MIESGERIVLRATVDEYHLSIVERLLDDLPACIEYKVGRVVSGNDDGHVGHYTAIVQVNTFLMPQSARSLAKYILSVRAASPFTNKEAVLEPDFRSTHYPMRQRSCRNVAAKEPSRIQAAEIW